MHCEDAARALYAGETPPDLELHLSACDECRALSEDLAQMNAPSPAPAPSGSPRPTFRVTLPLAPWRRLAIAASLLVIPLAGWARFSIQGPQAGLRRRSRARAARDRRPTDRELLGSLFLGEGQE
jgi:hypothetical protein